MKDYQERMTEKYGSAKKLFKKINPRYLRKEHLHIDYNNVITIKENTPISYWDMTKAIIKEIEINGEIYSKVIKESKAEQFYRFIEQDKKDCYEYEFGLLDLKYKFVKYYLPGHSSQSLYLYPHSQNHYVNYIYYLFKWGFLDNKILNVEFGKFSDDGYIYKDSLKEDILKEQTQDIKIRILLESYGWRNAIKYEISLDTFFEMDYKKIKMYAYDYIEFFKKMNLDLKNTNYAERIWWHERKLQDAKEAKRAVELMKANEHLFVEQMKQSEYVRPKSKCYILKDHNTGLYKIGKSVNPVFRERTLQSEKPTIEAVKIFKKDHEDELHKKYAKQRIRGEWFKLNKIQLKYICKTYA